MHISPRSFPLAAAFACFVPLVACSIDVGKARSGKNSDVDIRTPAGSLSVRTDVNVHDTGLAIYPGAWRSRDSDDDRDSANVNIGTPWFGLKVVAAKLESDASPERVLDFYRNELKSYGSVTECRGNLDFKGRRGAKQPVCKATSSSNHIQLIAGTEERQHIVDVKPLSAGSQFSLIYVETRSDR